MQSRGEIAAKIPCNIFDLSCGNVTSSTDPTAISMPAENHRHTKRRRCNRLTIATDGLFVVSSSDSPRLTSAEPMTMTGADVKMEVYTCSLCSRHFGAEQVT